MTRSASTLRGLRAALLLAAAALAPAARALTPAEFFAKVAPSIWLVRTYDQDGLPLATGSAVVVAKDTLITNCHVLRKARSFKVTHEGTKLDATLEMWDAARDVCQVKAPNLNAPAVPQGETTRLVVGQQVYALGNPKGLELTLSNGLISSLRRDSSQQLALIQTSAPISHGSSGGGLFDIDGKLIGITSSGVEDGQNLGFALPVDFIRELPARHLAALQKAPPSPPPPERIIAAAPPPPPAPAPAPAPPPQDTTVASASPGAQRVPFLSDRRQQQYREYLATASYPRACAISENGHFSCTGGIFPRDRSLPNDPKARALKMCEQYAGMPCMLYQVDDKIVYQPPTP